MFRAVVNLALENKKAVLAIFLGWSAAGLYALAGLPVDAVPDITGPQLMIVSRTGAIDPVRVERTVTYVIETEIQGVPGIQDIRSISKYGLSLITVLFEEGTNMALARQRISERLNQTRSELPEGISPQLAPAFTGLGEVYFYALVPRADTSLARLPEKQRLTQLRYVQDYVVKPQLKRVPGVADVDTFGGYPREIHITVDPARLERFGLTLLQLTDRLETLGENFGGGYIEKNGEQIIVRTMGRVTDTRQIGLIPVKRNIFGQNVRLGDVCRIEEKYPQPLGGASLNGEEAIIGLILMAAGGNSRNVAAAADRAVQALDLPEDVEVRPLYSRDTVVNATVRTVAKNLAEGAALVVVVLLLILGRFRAAVITALAIPVSMLMTFVGMRLFGISGNLMSLGAIDFGLLVDGTVVLFENVLRRMDGKPRELSLRERNLIVRDAVLEVIRPVVVSLLVIAGVFVPLFALEGVEGKMFAPMAATVTLALLSSLLVAVVLMPVLARLFLKPSRGATTVPFLVRWMLAAYRPALDFSLKHKPGIFVVTAGLVVLSAFAFLRMGADFIPRLDEGDMVINLARPAATSFTASLSAHREAERTLLQFPEAERAFSRFGMPASATDASGVYFGDVFVVLKQDRSLWRRGPDGRPVSKTALFQAMKEAIDQNPAIPHQELSLTQPIEMRFNEMLEGSRADVTLRIYGEDLEELERLATQAKDVIHGQTGVLGVFNDPLTAVFRAPVLDIRVDYHALAFHNFTIGDVNRVMEMAMGGHRIGTVYSGPQRVPVIVRMDEKLRNDVTAIGTIPLSTDDGGNVPLRQVASLGISTEVTTVARSQGRRYVALSIYLSGVDVETFVTKARADLEAKVKIPPLYETSWGGQFKNLERARARLTLVVPVLLAAILLLLGWHFGNWRDALIVFSGIPLSAVGGIITLGATGTNFSISAAVGFIALMGISVLNSMVLVEGYREHLEEEPDEDLLITIRDATLERIRPVVITTLVAGLGFLPMALNTGLGAEVQKPLATVVIGGLLVATVLTTFLVPALYLVFARASRDTDDEPLD